MTPGEELAAYLGARPGGLDGTKVVPMLCEREEAGSKVLGRKGWLFELKLDGVRIIADKKSDLVTLSYRKRRDATESYAEIAGAVRTLADSRLVLDGEIVAFDEQGRPDFQRLGHRIQTGAGKRGGRAPASVPVVYVVFDVLAIGPYDVRAFPLEARKEILSRVIPAEGAAGGLVRRHPTFDDGVELFRLCQEHRLEGVVAKKLGSSYRAGERSLDWLKIKAELDAEFVVIGWTEGESDRARLGALDLGAYEGDRLVFRGRVGSGLDASTIDMLLERLLPIEVDKPVAEGKYSPKPKRHHCLPELVVSVRYGGFSVDPERRALPALPGLPRRAAGREPEGLHRCAGRRRGARHGHGRGRPRSRRKGGHARSTERSRRAYGASAAHPRHGAAFGAPPRRHDEGCALHLISSPSRRRSFVMRADACARSSGPPARRSGRPRSGRRSSCARPPSVPASARSAGSWSIRSTCCSSRSRRAVRRSSMGRSSKIGRTWPTSSRCARASLATEADVVELAAAARSVRALADGIGLPSAPVSAGANAIDVVVGVGAAPALAAAPLGLLLVHLAAEGVAPNVKLEAVPAVTTPFAPCPGRAGEPVVVAVPLDWDELDRVDLASIGLAAAAARALGAARFDSLDAVRDARVDVAAATKALERVVAARAAK